MRLLFHDDHNDHALMSDMMQNSITAQEIDMLSSKRTNTVYRQDVVVASKLRYMSVFGSSVKSEVFNLGLWKDYYESSITVQNQDLATISIKYDRDDYGRLQATSPMSIQSMKRDLRNVMVPDGTVDIDIINSAPTVIEQLCIKHGVHCLYLSDFNSNYQARMTELGGDYKVKNPKGLKNVMLFGSRSSNYSVPSWVESIKQERDRIVDGLRVHYPVIYKSAEEKDASLKSKADSLKKRKTNHGDAAQDYQPNVNGIFMSYLYQHFEGVIMDFIDATGREMDMWDDHVSLIYDGIMVFKPRVIDLSKLEQGVESKTGIKIKLSFKPLMPKLEMDYTSIPAKMVVPTNDHHAAADILEVFMEDKIIREESGYVYGITGKTWKVLDESSLSKYLLGHLFDINIVSIKIKDEEEIETNISRYIPSAKHIVSGLMGIYARKPGHTVDFAKKVILDGCGQLVFPDGVYDFREENGDGLHGVFKKDKLIDTFVTMPCPFPKRIQSDMDFVMENIINPIFDNTEEGLKELFLSALSRAIAGFPDKVTYIIYGPRNSGKSVLFQFLSNSFGGYVATVPSSTFSNANQISDPSRKNGYMLYAENARILKMSEMPADASHNKAVIEGSRLKEFQSAKEGIQARGLYKTEKLFYSLATGFFMMNDIPEFAPSDSMDRCQLFKLPNEFVTADKIPEKRETTREMYMKLQNQEVEKWVMEDKYKDAFIHIILEAYKPEPIEPLPSMIEEKRDAMVGCGLEAYEGLIDVTMNSEDFVMSVQMRNVLTRNGIRDNFTAMKYHITQLVQERFKAEGQPVPSDKDIHRKWRKRDDNRNKMGFCYVQLRVGSNGNNNDRDEGGDDGMAAGFFP